MLFFFAELPATFDFKYLFFAAMLVLNDFKSAQGESVQSIPFKSVYQLSLLSSPNFLTYHRPLLTLLLLPSHNRQTEAKAAAHLHSIEMGGEEELCGKCGKEIR